MPVVGAAGSTMYVGAAVLIIALGPHPELVGKFAFDGT